MASALISSAVPYLLAGVAALAGGMVFISRIRSNARKAEREAQRAKTLEIKERQDEAAAAAPRTRGDLARRLRDGTF